MNRRAAIFALVLWLIATMFLGGDLGRWNDDYEFNQRVPETGRFDRLSEPMEGQFWRPLFFTIVPALQTLCWDHAWINHAIQAVAHGLAAMALFQMLGALSVSKGVRGPLAMLFLTCPVTFQAIFWSASLPTILSPAAFMLAATLYIGWVRGRGGPERLAAIVGLCTLIPLMNEQPAPALAAFPLLWMGAATGAVPRRAMAARALGPLLIIGVIYAVYLGAYLATSPPGYPATRSTLVHADQIGPRLTLFWHRAVECLALGGGWGSFMRTGIETIGAAGWWGVLCALAAVFSASAWVAQARPEEREPDSIPAVGRLPTAMFGVGVFVLSWSPIFAITTYEPASRLFYTPLIGVLVTLGALIDSVCLRVPAIGGAARFARAAVAAACLIGAVCLVGAQRAFRDSDRTDASYADQLRGLVPAPRHASFFVPVRIDDPVCRLAPTWLDLNFHTILLSSFNARMWIKFALGRSDVYCGTYSPDHGAYPSVDAHGLGFAWKFVDPAIKEGPPGVWRVPWSEVVPFEVDGLGTLRIVPRIVLERADNADTVIEVPEGDRNWGRSCAFYDHAADASVHPLGAWAWADGGVVTFARERQWTAVHSAARLGEAPTRRVMSTPLPPTPAITTLYFRVTLPEAQALPRPDAPGAGARITWSVEGAAPGVIHTAVLTSASVGADQRWAPVTLTIGPHPGADWSLRVAVEPENGLAPATPLVTSGLWSARLP